VPPRMGWLPKKNKEQSACYRLVAKSIAGDTLGGNQRGAAFTTPKVQAHEQKEGKGAGIFDKAEGGIIGLRRDCKSQGGDEWNGQTVHAARCQERGRHLTAQEIVGTSTHG